MESKIDVFIDKDGAKYKKKKLNLENTLAVIRKELKLSENIFFITKDDYPVDIEDEEETKLNEILIVKNSANYLNLKTNTCNIVMINVFLNNEKIYFGSYTSSILIKDLEKDYKNLLPEDAILQSQGYPMDPEDYEDKKVIDFLENNNLFYVTKNINKKEAKNITQKETEDDSFTKGIEANFEMNKSDDSEEIINIKIGQENKIKKLKKIDKLNDIREILKKELNFRFKFLFNKTALEENEEDKWTINDILKEEDNQKIIYIQNCEKEDILQEETKTIKFYDFKNPENLLIKCKLNINQNLEGVRDAISDSIIKDFKFMKKKEEIDEDEESDIILKTIIKQNSVKLKIIDEEKMNNNQKTMIKFKLNDKELFANKIDHNLTLFEIRNDEKNMIPKEAVFIKDGFKVTNEKNTKIGDILKDGEFILLKDEIEEKDLSTPQNNVNQKKKYEIYLNEKLIKTFSLKEDTTLEEMRKYLSTSIKDNDLFITSDNSEIPLETESSWTLKDFGNDETNKIYIKTMKEPEPEKPEIILNKPIEGSIPLCTESSLTIYQYPNKEFNDMEKNMCKTIMAVGETGSGKTTLLNSFLNYLMDIKYEDKFRYKIIVENENKKKKGASMTDFVNIYYIRTQKQELKYLRIVDTPGFGDTRGPEYDKKIIDMIRETFTNKCNSINAICFVAKSTETRLTDFQKYIFAQVMSLFGNDVGENFIAMLTFSDGQIPNIVQSLESEESVFYPIKMQIEDPWYLKFNNSAMFCGTDERFTKNFWDLAMAMYTTFYQKLLKLPQKSLVLSKEVLELRKQLETTIVGLRPRLDKSLTIMENMRNEIAFIKANKDKIDQFKDFNYKFKEPKVTKKNLEQGHYTSNCLICNYTCHYPCYINNDNNKNRCSAMKNGFCTVCQNKCKWDQHKNLNFIYIYEEVEKIKTSEELKKKYVESSSKLKKSEQILQGLEKEFLEILTDCYNIADTIKSCVEKLKEISLCKNPNESFEDYITNCIMNEEREKKPGYEKRIKGFELLKKTNEEIIRAFKGQSIYENLEKFKEYIFNEKKELVKLYEKEEKKEDSKCSIF